MQIKDGSIKVLVVNYGQPNAPNLVPVGYKFQNSPHNLKEFVRIVRNLNQTAGWHYRDGQFNIGGRPYTIAEVWEGDKPLREIYQIEAVTDQGLMNILLQYCLSVSDLSIPKELRTYVQPQIQPQPQVQPQPQTQPQQVEPVVNKSKYLEYLTEKEIADIGDLNSLSDEEAQLLEDLYEQRKGEHLQKSLVKYELPNELSNYNLVYREAVLGKSVLVEGKTSEEIESLKHELGSGAVVEAMIQEVPRQEGREVGKEDSEDLMSTFKYLGRALSRVFKGTYSADYGGEVPPEMEVSPTLSGIVNRLLVGIRTTYGSYSNFLNKFVDMQVGEDVLPPAAVQHRNLTEEYRTVKAYDNMSGYYIGFVKADGSYMFPLALFEITAYMEDSRKLLGNITFESAYNATLEDFCREINKTGLNIGKMRFSVHKVDVVSARYLGKCVDEGNLVYLFRRLPEAPESYFIIYANNLGNKLFGSRYLIEGENFRINYMGETIVVSETEPVMLNTEEKVYDFIDKYGDFVTDPVPGYYAMLDINKSSDIANNEYRRIIESYEELIPKTLSAGYTWDATLTESGGIEVIETPQENPVPAQGFTPQRPEVVDIFSAQPTGVFTPPQDEIDIKKPTIYEEVDIKKPSPVDVDEIDIKKPTIYEEVDIKKPSPEGENAIDLNVQPIITRHDMAFQQNLKGLETVYSNLDDSKKEKMNLFLKFVEEFAKQNI